MDVIAQKIPLNRVLENLRYVLLSHPHANYTFYVRILRIYRMFVAKSLLDVKLCVHYCRQMTTKKLKQ